ncbi:uncharacterized protein PHALS_06770 [Plasmopara halstedii]|uniref:Uncharacterized protein n=1 Tax=Plasmopara halstedii TaxID=4781 RepID=A0A0P1B627_PLAHL|nr:uncharacterized protein PHALS_06770 [Plasmopara halstedii]CEG48980.1 hypothetical protein PHALS_06770 [Plasmopara halstedii]|eukprot:XP_024585349.1 hypothetical protein PHALS_06770 [Plasmopara halstedii]
MDKYIVSVCSKIAKHLKRSCGITIRYCLRYSLDVGRVLSIWYYLSARSTTLYIVHPVNQFWGTWGLFRFDCMGQLDVSKI